MRSPSSRESSNRSIMFKPYILSSGNPKLKGYEKRAMRGLVSRPPFPPKIPRKKKEKKKNPAQKIINPPSVPRAKTAHEKLFMCSSFQEAEKPHQSNICYLVREKNLSHVNLVPFPPYHPPKIPDLAQFAMSSAGKKRNLPDYSRPTVLSWGRRKFEVT